MRTCLHSALIAAGLSCGLPAPAADPARALPLHIAVEAGKHDRLDTPVSVVLPAPVGRQAVHLVETSGGRSVPVAVQVEAGEPARLWWVLSGRTAAGQRREFELRPGRVPDTPRVTATEKGGAVEVRRGDTPALRYHVARVPPPTGLGERYGRSAFLHPVWTPRGAVVTEMLAPDHPHQDGIFLAYTQTQFEGRRPNFWDLQGGTGLVRCARLDRVVNGPVFGSLRALHEHVDLGVPGGKVALRETWDVCVWQRANPHAPYGLFDITSTMCCATASPLLVRKNFYGGMAVRGAREWAGDHCRFLTSEGRTRRDGNQTRARWCDVSGPAGDRSAGILIMSHPANFRFPEPVRLHPTMPYMCFAPEQIGEWAIEPGKPHTVRYRYAVHDGDLSPAEAERLWRDWAEPPVTRIEIGKR